MVTKAGVPGVFLSIPLGVVQSPFHAFLASGPHPTTEVGTVMNPNFYRQVGKTLRVNKGRPREVQELVGGVVWLEAGFPVS